MHIEWFEYDVNGHLQKECIPMAILFDYTVQPARYTHLNSLIKA